MIGKNGRLPFYGMEADSRHFEFEETDFSPHWVMSYELPCIGVCKLQVAINNTGQITRCPGINGGAHLKRQAFSNNSVCK